MTHPNTVKRLEGVLNRLEAGASYSEVRETLIDIYNGLGGGEWESVGRAFRRDEIGRYAAEAAEFVADRPGLRVNLDTEIGMLTLEMQR